MKSFDYFFYRIAKFYYRKDGSDAIRAIAILSLIQALLVGTTITIILRLIYGYPTVAKHAKLYSDIGAMFY